MADKKEKKLGDEIVVVGPHGGTATYERSQFPDLSDEDWSKLKDSVRPLPPPVPADTPAPLGERAPVRVLEPGAAVVAPNGATERQVQEGGTPGTYSKFDELNERVVAPVQEFMKNPVVNALDTTIGAALRPILDPTGDKTPLEAPAPPAAAVVAPKAGGDGSAAVRVPGTNPGDYNPKVFDNTKEQVEADTKLARVKAFQMGQQALALGEQKQAELDMRDILERHAADIMATEAAEQARMQKFEDEFSALKAELNKLDPTIYPNRYWLNKDAGQITLGAIAGALFGFAGKGMDYLQNIQNEVKMDIEAQKSTYENASSKVRQQMAAAGDTYARARARGLSQREAEAASFVAKTSAAKALIQATVTNTSSVEAQGRAMELLAGIDSMNAKTIAIGAQAAAEASARAKAAEAQLRSANAALMNAGANVARASGANGKGGKLPATIAVKVAAAKRLLNTLEQMQQTAKGEFLEKGGRAIKSLDPGLTEAGRKQGAQTKNYNLNKVSLGIDVAASAMAKHESEIIMDEIPSPNNPLQDTDTFFEQRKDIVKKHIESLLEGAGVEGQPEAAE